MRHAIATIASAFVLTLFAGAAEAKPFDAKALARYDHSYVECEAMNPAMKGQRDVAYLNLWRIAPDDKSRARLAKLRADPAYVAETRRVAKLPAGAAGPSSAVQRQCMGLWAEHQRAGEPKRP